MYIHNGIAYAGDSTVPIRIVGVRPLPEYRLWLRFNTGETRLFDFSPLLGDACFIPLQDPVVFNGVYIDYGCCVWNDGDIDISPEYLYRHSVPVGGKTSA